MSVRHAVLALLLGGESYGYELKPAFEEAVGPQWGELNIGHLYQVLDRLRRDGLVSGQRVHQPDRPDKTVYRLTDAGRAELDRWLATPSIRRSGYRDALFLKVFAAARLGEEALGGLLSRERAALLGELRALSELPPELAGDPLVGLLVDTATVATRGRIEVLERAAERVPALVRAARRAGPARRAAGAGTGDYAGEADAVST